MVPRNFNILGRTFTVRYVDELGNDRGVCDFERGIIVLCSSNMADDRIEQTFWHETVHAILYAMGESDLSSDEKFVDKLASLLHQVIKTSNY